MNKQKAIEFAKKHHKGQFRKFNKEPYINHCIRVAEDTQSWSTDIDPGILYIVGLCHDLLEDTDVIYYELESEFSEVVADSVNLLTRQNWQTYYDFLRYIVRDAPFMTADKEISKIACYVKLSDLKDNISDLEEGSLRDKYRLAERFILDRLEERGE